MTNLPAFEYSDLSEQWLTQFTSKIDRELARQYLRSLKLVSHTDFERGIRDLLQTVIEKVKTENVALFTVSEQVAKKWPGAPQRRIPGSSTDLIKQLLENYSRISPNCISSHPTVHSMRAERIKNIVLVDDLIGSGKRLSDFWLYQVSPSIKSWISYKWTKLWVVSYAAYTPGIIRIRKTIKNLDKCNFLTVLPPLIPCAELPNAIRNLAKEYALKTSKPKIPYGFGDCGSTIIFEHGCPNNAPPILWDTKSKNWSPLFVGRGIPSELAGYFTKSNTAHAAETLWSHGQYRAALGILDREELKSRPAMELQLILAIGIVSMQTWNDTNLQQKLRLPASRIKELRHLAYGLELINLETGKLTGFGQEFLTRVKFTAKEKAAGHVRAVAKASPLYYPFTCGGKKRH